MGAGKSIVGRLLAELLRVPFADTDTLVEQEAGSPIAEIFEREGQAGFRLRERAAIDAWAGRRAVVAVGGGAIAQPGASERLGASGTVVYLKARPETLLARIGDPSTRPLLRDLDDAARLGEVARLLGEREGAYATARVVVETDGWDAVGVAEAVMKELT